MDKIVNGEIVECIRATDEYYIFLSHYSLNSITKNIDI